MDSTLNQILETANFTQEKIFDNSITINDCFNSLHKLRSYVDHIRSVASRVEKIHEICLEKIHSNLYSITTTSIDKNRIGTKKWNTNILNQPMHSSSQNYPESTKKEIPIKSGNSNTKDGFNNKYTPVASVRYVKHKTAKSNYLDQKVDSSLPKLLIMDHDQEHNQNDSFMKLCAPGISIRTRTVKTIDMVPNTKLYWVENIKQFALRVNDIIIRGDIGNIYTKCDIRNKCSVENISKCWFGAECTSKKCSYYHDPLELVKNNIKVDIPIIRHYTDNSWLFIPTDIKDNNKNMKHLGNRNSLKVDIIKFSKADKKIVDNEISMMINQTMHNLLILLALSQNKSTSKMTFLGC